MLKGWSQSMDGGKWDAEKQYTSNRYCYSCKQTTGNIRKVNKHDPPKRGHSYSCPKCTEEIYKKNNCKSSRAPCGEHEKFKCRCGSRCSPCRSFWAWTANLHHQELEIMATGAREGIVKSSFNGENKLIRICAVCARWDGVVCKPFYNEDYLLDHQRAKCVNCHLFKFREKKSYGYCSTCQVKN